MILKVRRGQLNVKKKVGILGLFLLLFSLFLINAPPAYGATILEYTVDSGQFNTWLHINAKIKMSKSAKITMYKIT